MPLVQLNNGENNEYSIDIVENIADHVLVTGPDYQPKQIKLIPANYLGKYTSGVMGKYRHFSEHFKSHLIHCTLPEYPFCPHPHILNVFFPFSCGNKQRYQKNVSNET